MILYSKLPTIVAALVIGGMTVASSVAGFSRVAQTFHQPDIEQMSVPEVRAVADSAESAQSTDETALGELNSQGNSAALGTTTKTNQTTAQVGGTSTPKPTVSPTSHPVASTPITGTSGASTPVVDNRCIITLSGNQYDVTTLQTTHSGGNVFNCGTDMTAAYLAQHGSSLARMEPYKNVAGATSAGTPNTSNSTGSSQSNSTNISKSSSEHELDNDFDEVDDGDKAGSYWREHDESRHDD